MPVRSLKRVRPFVWIPPVHHPVWKVTIERSDGTVDDVTDFIWEGEVTDAVTEEIGSFSFRIDNSTGQWTNVWSGNEIVRFYADYATEATTLRFRGRIEKVKYKNNDIVVTGRSEALKLLNITVTKSYTDTETSQILKNLFDTYATEFTYNNVNTSTTSITVNWYQKPFWDCVKELCKAAGFDCYIDANLDCHYFAEKSVKNYQEAMVHDQNILDIGEFAEDLAQIRNRVIVYGAEVEGVPIIYTAEDTDSQSRYGIKEEIISDSNITTIEAARDRAEAELALLKNPPIVGEITSIGLPTLAPGQCIRISAPDSGIQPGWYKIIKFTHKVSTEDVMLTTALVEKEAPKIPKLFKQRIEAEQKLADMPNPYELRYSYIIDFNSSVGTHSGTEIVNGVLRLKSGSTTGTWISPAYTHSSDITQVQLKASGSGLAGVVFWVSADNGIHWDAVSKDMVHTVSSSGNKLRIKIQINSSTTEIDSVGVLFK